MEPTAHDDTMLAADPPDAEAERARALVRSRLFGADDAKIGRYRIVERLGSGAMGIVYRAHDPALDRPVALKVLQTAASVTSGARLKVEARALAQLSHPNVVQVYEVGEDAGRGFVAMELVEGEDLAKRLARERPSPVRAARLFVALGEGLAAAHAVDVLHRDFKPANVLIGADGRPRIVDFGLARAPDPTPGELPTAGESLTLSGSIVGTPAYLAPELWSRARASPASDQWAFCVSFYEALFGQRPFRGATIAVLSRRITAGERQPEPPGHRVPAWLLDVVNRGLAPAPDDRFPDMNALVAAVQRGLVRGRRRRLGAGIAAALISATAVGALLPTAAPVGCADVPGEARSLWARGNERRVEADLRRAGLPDATAAAARVAAVADEHATQWRQAYAEACADEGGSMDAALACLGRARARFLAQLDGLSSLEPEPEIVYAAVDALADLPAPGTCLDPPRFAPPPDEARVARLRALMDRARVLRTGRSVAAALPLAEQVATEARYPPLRAEALALYGGVLRLNEEHARAVEVLDEAWTLATELEYDEVATEAAVQLVLLHGGDLRAFDVADRWAGHARSHAGPNAWEVDAAVATTREAHGDYARAREMMQAAHDGAVVELGPGHARTLALLLRLLDLAADLGDNDGAAKLLEEARARVGALDPGHPLQVTLHANAAQYLTRVGEFDAAVREADQAIELLDAVAPERLGRRGDLEGLAAVALGIAGQHEASRERFVRARDLYTRAYGEDDVRVARVLRNLAVHAGRTGDLDEGIRLSARAVTIMEATLGAESNEAASARDVLGETLINAGQYDRAVEEYRKARAVLEANLGPDHFMTVSSRIGLAQALLWSGQEQAGLADAAALLEELPEDHPRRCFLLSEAAGGHHKLGQLEVAEDRYRAALTACADDPDEQQAHAHYGLASVLVARHKYADAIAHAREAERLWAGEEVLVASALTVHAEARYEQRGGRREAVDMARAARAVLEEHHRPVDQVDEWLATHPP